MTKREKFSIFILFVFIIGFLAFTRVLKPRIDEAMLVAKRLGEKEHLLEKYEEAISKKPELMENREKLLERESQMLQGLFMKENIRSATSDLLEMFNEMAKSSETEIVTEINLPAQRMGPLTKIFVRSEVRGSFSSILKLIHAIENSDKYLSVDELDIREGEKGLEATVLISAASLKESPLKISSAQSVKKKAKQVSFKQYEFVLERKWFATKYESLKENGSSGTDEISNQENKKKAIRLVGTIVYGDGRGMVFIEKSEGVVELYKDGDMIGEEEIVSVQKDSILVSSEEGMKEIKMVVPEGEEKEGDQEEVITELAQQQQSSGILPLPGADEITSVIGYEEEDERHGSLISTSKKKSFKPSGSLLLSGLVVRTVSIKGEPRIVVFSVSEGSYAEEIGLLKGDVIEEVNGKSIKGIQDLFKAVSSLKVNEALIITLERNGKREVISM